MNTPFNRVWEDTCFVLWQSAFSFLCMFTFICFDKRYSFLHVLCYLLWWWMLLLVVEVIDSRMLFCLIVFSVMKDSMFRRPHYRKACIQWRGLIIYYFWSCWFSSSPVPGCSCSAVSVFLFCVQLKYLYTVVALTALKLQGTEVWSPLQ